MMEEMFEDQDLINEEKENKEEELSEVVVTPDMIANETMIDFLELQRKVDYIITEEKGINHDMFIDNKIIAFKVELGEFANEVGYFKYWKENKTIDHDRIKDEWADCLAFLLSIVNTCRYNIESLFAFDYCIDVAVVRSLNDLFESNFESKLNNEYELTGCLNRLYAIGYKLGYTINELNEAYKKKSLVNIERAKGGY